MAINCMVTVSDYVYYADWRIFWCTARCYLYERESDPFRRPCLVRRHFTGSAKEVLAVQSVARERFSFIHSRENHISTEAVEHVQFRRARADQAGMRAFPSCSTLCRHILFQKWPRRKFSLLEWVEPLFTRFSSNQRSLEKTRFTYKQKQGEIVETKPERRGRKPRYLRTRFSSPSDVAIYFVFTGLYRTR